MSRFICSTVWSMVILSIFHRISGLSYNQLIFCPNATWDSNGITLATFFWSGIIPTGLFVDTTNTVYADATGNSDIFVWFQGSPNQATTISAGLSSPYSIFATTNGDIYADNGAANGRVDKWILNATDSTIAMYVPGACTGLFIDINDNLYCSLSNFHQVIMKALSSNVNSSTVVAGTGAPGAVASMLRNPCGIFVDISLDLYVADYNNDRIQVFLAGQLNGTTVAGNGASTSFALNGPSGIVLDADGYLFIADQLNSRIVGSGPNGFRCLVGCSTIFGISFELSQPRSLSFDSFGNLFVTDSGYKRIQKFILATNSCDFTVTNVTTSTTVQTTTTSTLNNYVASVFVPTPCPNQTQIGVHCNASAAPCDILDPCLNDGTCFNIDLSPDGYSCFCLSGFHGINCQIDSQPCRTDTCWNGGICNQTSSTTYTCLCQSGWTDMHCETKIDFCEGVQCQNNGVCRSLLLNFTCECLGTSYSGRYCEITAQQILIHQIVSKSLGYIAILCMSAVASFVVIMDVLKYFFGIDPTTNQLKRMKKAKVNKKRKRVGLALRFTYVNKPRSILITTSLSPTPPIAIIGRSIRRKKP